MEAAKAHVKKFISKDGSHDTSIHEKVAPAVQQETVNRTQHDEATTAVDREVHQDHYHTTEQPVFDKEVLPEQHHHSLLPTEERSYEHDDSSRVKERLAQEASQYKSSQAKVEGAHSTSAAPDVAGEHVHHHVYETVQPVVQKETVEPHVVHTTKPIHEVHHNEAQHHSASALPAVSMDEFKNKGGALTGRDERKDRVAGCPPDQFSPHGNGHGHSHTSHDSGVVPSSTNTLGSTSNSHSHPVGASYGNDMHNDSSRSFGSVDGREQQTKPSMMDKLNPKKDADNDGKAGMMN